MNAVVTAKEMAALDAYTIEQLQIPGVVLMENAGRGIAEMALHLLKKAAGKIVHIYCGQGNNGGDGYVVARHLLNHNVGVHTFILAQFEKISGDALINLKAVQNMGHAPEFIESLPDLDEKPDLIIDAMLGTGVKGALRGLYADVVEYINKQQAPVLAVDIPTGVNADTGQVDGPAIQATVTATMALPKRGLLFSPGREHVGRLKIVDISMPPQVVKDQHPRVFHVDREYISSILPRRSPDAFKNRVGMIHVVAGSKGFTGAAVLTSKATLRAGAGLCYLSVPDSLYNIIDGQCAEVITHPVPDEQAGHFVSNYFATLQKEVGDKSALVLGPGLGTAKETVQLVHAILSNFEIPLVLDADGLNACAENTELFAQYGGDLVITPHPGELGRLTDLSTRKIVTNRVDIARQYAQEWQCTLVLKGGPTVTAFADGRVFINSTGNAGMATAGSGDVLSGFIGGLIGQEMHTLEAAVAAVFLHGLAGDIAFRQLSNGLMAGDILDSMPAAFLSLQELS